MFVGCKPSYPSSPSYKIVTAEEITNFIVDTNGIHALLGTLVPDTEYAIPTVEWIEKYYTPQLKQFLFDYQLNSPSSIENDCDKYAQYGLTIGHVMHHHANKPKNTALTIGEFMYIDSIVAHVINFFIAIDKDNQIKLVFYEPQTQQIILLDVKDVAVLYWRM
jgi:hypothetical protein